MIKRKDLQSGDIYFMPTDIGIKNYTYIGKVKGRKIFRFLIQRETQKGYRNKVELIHEKDFYNIYTDYTDAVMEYAKLVTEQYELLQEAVENILKIRRLLGS